MCALGSYHTHIHEDNMNTELLEPLNAARRRDGELVFGRSLRVGDLVGFSDVDVIHFGRISSVDGEWSLVRVEDEEGMREHRVRRLRLCRL